MNVGLYVTRVVSLNVGLYVALVLTSSEGCRRWNRSSSGGTSNLKLFVPFSDDVPIVCLRYEPTKTRSGYLLNPTIVAVMGSPML